MRFSLSGVLLSNYALGKHAFPCLGLPTLKLTAYPLVLGLGDGADRNPHHAFSSLLYARLCSLLVVSLLGNHARLFRLFISDLVLYFPFSDLVFFLDRSCYPSLERPQNPCRLPGYQLSYRRHTLREQGGNRP